MGYFEDEMKKEKKEFSALSFKSQRRNLKKSDYQIGKTIVQIDKKRKALAPGKRKSKAGNIYYENRKNRSDLKGNI
jgi:hypothetical protein